MPNCFQNYAIDTIFNISMKMTLLLFIFLLEIWCLEEAKMNSITMITMTLLDARTISFSPSLMSGGVDSTNIARIIANIEKLFTLW